MAKKPLRVFKAGTGQADHRERVYKNSSDVDNATITQEVKQLPKAHVSRKKESKTDRYSSLLHCIYDAVLITDTSGSILEVNARAEHMLVYKSDDLKSMNVTDILAGADSKLLEVLTENVNESHFTLLE